MPIFVALTALVAVSSAALLVLVILLQEPRGGASTVLGGTVQDVMGAGRLPRLASTLAGVWIGACLLHAVLT